MNNQLSSPSKSNYPITTDLIFRLLAINILGNSYLYADEFKLPFFDALQNLITVPHLVTVLTVIVMMGMVLMFFSKLPQIGTLLVLIGMSIVIFGCRSCYADSRLFIYSLLILLTLYQKSSGLLFIRFQVIILYLGCGLNKMFDHDWQTGQYLHNWLGNQLDFGPYNYLSGLLPEMLFAKIMSWSVIFCELLMAFCFSRKRLFHVGIWLGVFFHSGSIIAANSTFGSFVAGSFIAYLAFLNWPKEIVISLKRKSKLMGLLQIIDPYRITKVIHSSDFSGVSIDGVQYLGLRAIQLYLLYCPICYLIVIGMLVAPGFNYDWLKGCALLIISFFMLPIWSKRSK